MDYIDRVTDDGCIAEWVAGCSSVDEVVDAVIDRHPLVGDMTRDDVVSLVEAEIAYFNERCASALGIQF
jgi:hypothetical protein